MMRSAGPTTLAVLLLLSSCATVDPLDPRGSCGGDDPRPWVIADTAPANADALRHMADRHPNFRGSNAHSAETWFTLADGEVMLCRSDGRPGESCAGQWWQFGRRPGEAPWIADTGAWICVA